MPETTTATGLTAVAVVMVPVNDQDAAIAFYTEKLGLELRADVPFGGSERWVEVAPAGGEARLALVSPRQDGSGTRPGEVQNVSIETKDVDATHAELKSRGVDVDAEIMRMGDVVPPMFWLRDPDGNVLLVVQSA
jgi:catechol 2,3-dioxygenase-like lactoylglutathione lyase family enzyme